MYRKRRRYDSASRLVKDEKTEKTEKTSWNSASRLVNDRRLRRQLSCFKLGKSTCFGSEDRGDELLELGKSTCLGGEDEMTRQVDLLRTRRLRR